MEPQNSTEPGSEYLTFEDVSQESVLSDEWLFSSTRRYQHISMYEHEKMLNAGSWVTLQSEQCVLVGTNSEYNDVVLYRLPQNLYFNNDELSKCREISIMASSSCTTATHSLQTVSIQDRLYGLRVTTDSEVILHKIPEFITDNTTIQELSQLAVLDNDYIHPPSVTCVDNTLIVVPDVNAVEFVDVNNEKLTSLRLTSKGDEGTLKARSPRVSCVEALNSTVCVMCQKNNGNVIQVDRRSGEFENIITPPNQFSRTLWFMNLAAGQIYLTNNHNKLLIYDLRKSDQPTIINDLQGVTWSPYRNHPIITRVHDSKLSITGMDNKVRIYSLRSSQLSSDIPISPVFIHDGHLPENRGDNPPTVADHSWNNTIENCLLSISDVGQIHSWIFNELT